MSRLQSKRPYYLIMSLVPDLITITLVKIDQISITYQNEFI